MWIIIIPNDRVDIKLNGLVFIKHLAQTLVYWSAICTLV